MPLNYRAKDAELEYMINTAGAKVLLAGDRYLDLMARVSPKLKTAKVVAMGRGHGRDAAARGSDQSGRTR